MRPPMVSMTAIITAMAAASLLAPNDKSLKNAVESNCNYVRSCDSTMMSLLIPHIVLYSKYMYTLYKYIEKFLKTTSLTF